MVQDGLASGINSSGIIGTLISAYIVDKFGRRRCLMAGAAVMALWNIIAAGIFEAGHQQPDKLQELAKPGISMLFLFNMSYAGTPVISKAGRTRPFLLISSFSSPTAPLQLPGVQCESSSTAGPSNRHRRADLPSFFLPSVPQCLLDSYRDFPHRDEGHGQRLRYHRLVAWLWFRSAGEPKNLLKSRQPRLLLVHCLGLALDSFRVL